MENNNKELEQFYDEQLAEIQAEQAKNLKKNKKKRKGLFAAIIALILAGSTLLAAMLLGRKQENDKGNLPTQPTTSTFLPDEDVSIDDIGTKYDDPNLNNDDKEYGEVTGDINKEDIVEKDETLWKDEEAADKSDEVGKEEIDDKDGTLEVKPNGDVFEKEEDYEIEKEDGTVVEGTVTEEDKQNGNVGSDGTVLPPGYVHDENLDIDVKEEDANKFVYCDANYYDSEGTLVYAKGDYITPEDLEMAKQYLTTTKPVIETEPEVKPEETEPEVKPEETPIIDEGVINPDGTYTIYGITYMSKEDYYQFLLYPEQYGYYNGMVLSLEDIEAMFNQKSK